MILVIGSNEEAHSKYIHDVLLKKNIDCMYFDSRKYPYDIQLSYSPDTSEGYIKIENTKIKNSDIQGIYWRWFYGVNYEKINDEYTSQMVYRERNSALNSFFKSLSCNWVNSFDAVEMHKTKIYQLNLLLKNNIRIPKTLITNDSDSLIEFYENNNKKVIYKPVLGGAITDILKDEDLTKEKLLTLKTAPIQLQEFVEGTDIRVYVFGDKIFPGEIKADTVDFRADNKSVPKPVDIPDNVKNDCLKIMKLLNLSYSGIDIKLSDKGEYVFIEANPAPMFMYFEKVTQYPITESLIELLTK